MPINKKKVVLGLSGGVDSSVCAFLLKEQGYEVIAVYMRNWDSFLNNEIHKKTEEICEQEKDYLIAKEVANQLQIEFHRVDFIKEYWNEVFQQFLKELKEGLTPNPDILCNHFVKFGAFKEYAKTHFDADWIAMGHYAKLIKNNNQIHLMIPKDIKKDQTYFLSYLSSSQLDNVMFPLADYTKEEVRKIALENNLVSASKKDSTGICFIGEKNMKNFLSNYLPLKKGNIVEKSTNKILSTHDGIWFYTIGQKKGLNLGGQKYSYYVCEKNLETNTLYVAHSKQENYLSKNYIHLSHLHFINEQKALSFPLNIEVKYRYRQSLQNATLYFENNKYYLKSEHNIFSVTPGQYAVFYLKNECLGCAKII